MSRLTETQTLTGAGVEGISFTAKRLNRLERANLKAVYYAVVRSLDMGSTPGTYLDEADIYASVVVAAEIGAPLPTMDGALWTPPAITADDATHYASFLQFCEVDPAITDEIIEVVNRVNATLAPAHIKPKEEVREADRANPNFLAGDNATSSASTPLPGE